jgi:hypothetical protein
MAREDVTSQFPTIGEQGYHQLVNLSGEKVPYTIMEPRGRSGGADTPGTGTKANRGASLIREANGPRPNTIPMATRWPANAACATEGQRNVVPVASAIGDRDFWGKRAEGPRI